MDSLLDREYTDASNKKSRPFIDCDVHVTASGIGNDTIGHYLPERWRRHQEVFRGTGYQGRTYPRAVPRGFRSDSWPSTGGPPGSNLDLLREQLLDCWDVRYAILAPGVMTAVRNLDYAAELAAAGNDWMAAKWLDHECRLRASMAIPYWDPPAAVREIDRRVNDTRFVQIYMPVRSTQPFGHRKYWPIYEAAETYGLPVGVHLGGADANPITGAGWPSFYIEEHVGMAQRFQAHVTSLVCEGVFEHFPGLKVVIIEGGISWLPPLAWRLDRAWEKLGSEVPHVKRPPSEYIADHIWLTTQPIEEPPKPEHFAQMMGSFPPLGARLMFATDYPHWDFDNPDQALRKIRLPPGTEEKIMSANASDLYGLPVGPV